MLFIDFILLQRTEEREAGEVLDSRPQLLAEEVLTIIDIRPSETRVMTTNTIIGTTIMIMTMMRIQGEEAAEEVIGTKMIHPTRIMPGKITNVTDLIIVTAIIIHDAIIKRPCIIFVY